MVDRVLAVDLGTTSVKAAVLNSGGDPVDRFSESYTTDRPQPGWAEQDPAHWTTLIDKALAKFHIALDGTRHGALTSQVNTHVFVDAAGKPLMPAITWQDTRAAPEAAELDARLGHDEKIALLGAPIPIDASHPLARMLWVKRHRPAIWDQTAHVLLPKDFALLHLTGQIVSDPLSNIGLVGTDGQYVHQILDLVPGANQRMAPLAGLTDIVGHIPHLDIAMANATMDAWVGLVGAGACREGAAAYLSGTSEVLGLCAEQVTHEPGVVVFAKAHGLRLHAGPSQSGGASAQWFCDTFNIDLDAMAQRVANRPRRQPTPLFLPQLAGERAPLWNADLRGAFLGLDSGTTQSDMARAVYEGVALSARHILTALEASGDCAPETLTCGGGGFEPAIWAQIRANVLNRPLSCLAVNEPGLIGAATLAAFAAGGYSGLTDAHQQFSSYGRLYEPDPKIATLYDDLFDIYRDAINRNAEIGLQLSSLGPQAGKK